MNNAAGIALFAVFGTAFAICAIWFLVKVVLILIDGLMERYEKWSERTNHMVNDCRTNGKPRGQWNKYYI